MFGFAGKNSTGKNSGLNRANEIQPGRKANTGLVAMGTNKVRIKKFSVVLLCFFFLMSQSTLAWAANARLTDIIVTNTPNQLLFFARIENAFNEKITEAVQSGVPATFSFIIKLQQTRGLWLDKKITELEVNHTIQYNNIKETYAVTRSWEKDHPLTTKSFAEAREHMCKIEGLILSQMDALNKGERYQIKAKAELDKMTLPFYLHYVLFFLSFWDIETDWHTIYFTY